jgi:cytosine/adenosine deaminase-related metal-dependent hydrolase
MDGPPIENGAVAISGNAVIDVGRFDEIKAHNVGDVVDLGEQVLLPGLINAHCHLDYTCLRGKIPSPKLFTDWIRAINAEKAKLSERDYVASIADGFTEAKRFGTTSMVNLEAFPELIAKLNEPIRTWWFAELIDVRTPNRAKEVVNLAVESLKQGTNWGLAPHALFTASASLYRSCEDVARSKNILLTTHLAESREEMSMFCDASGPLYEFMKEIGRPMEDCGHETPLARFLETVRDSSTVARNDKKGARNDKEWIVAHLNELRKSDFDMLARSTTRFHVIYCPRGHKYFRHSPFEFEKLRALGFNICLGTDSLASSDDLSLFAEMREFQKNRPRVSAEEVLSMVTVNPALALRQQNVLGKIRSGFLADLIAVPCRSARKNIFEEIIGFDGPVAWSMVDGKCGGGLGAATNR